MSSRPTLSYQVLDVFTDTPLEGNPLAVFTDADRMSAELMQALARELHLSETVFVLADDGRAAGRERDAGGKWAAGGERCDARIRIFTPLAELPFAGHPTLGAGFVVAGRDQRERVRLRTNVGIVPLVMSRREGRLAYGEMEQPLPRIEPIGDPGALLAALQVQASVMPVERYVNGPEHLLVALGDAEQVAALEPDLVALGRAAGQRAGGPTVTVGCFSVCGPRQVHARVFVPGIGEDQATGSAAGPLALHLVRHGALGWGETVAIKQGVEIRRPSRLLARVDGDGTQVRRIVVGGSAVHVADGEFKL